jgi:hypothetical protein
LTIGRVVEDRDIFRVAEFLVRNHGEKAVMECAVLVDRWTARGNQDSAEVWRRVMLAVGEMQTRRMN